MTSFVNVVTEMLMKIGAIGPWDLRFYIGFISMIPIYLVITSMFVAFILMKRKLWNK